LDFHLSFISCKGISIMTAGFVMAKSYCFIMIWCLNIHQYCHKVYCIGHSVYLPVKQTFIQPLSQFIKLILNECHLWSAKCGWVCWHSRFLYWPWVQISSCVPAVQSAWDWDLYGRGSLYCGSHLLDCTQFHNPNYHNQNIVTRIFVVFTKPY
jgi:hypothetical protein